MPGENTEREDLPANAQVHRPEPDSSAPADKAAASSRRLLFWLVVGVVVLNVLLFLKFGLERKSDLTTQRPGTNSPATAARTNAGR